MCLYYTSSHVCRSTMSTRVYFNQPLYMVYYTGAYMAKSYGINTCFNVLSKMSPLQPYHSAYLTCATTRPISLGCSSKVTRNSPLILMSSGKQVHEKNTPLNPTFIQKRWGLQGYSYFSYFCSKTLIVGTR